MIMLMFLVFGFDLVLQIRRRSSRGYELCFHISEVNFNRFTKDIRPQIQEYVYTGESGRISLLSQGGPHCLYSKHTPLGRHNCFY